MPQSHVTSKMKSPGQPKRKMQDISFRSIEEFLEFLPAEELKIVERLRNIILEAIPGCIEKLSYNVPYYKRNANICFIWPSSIPWGKMKQTGVRFGFTKGYLLQDDSGFLDKGNRKQVYYKDYYALKEIDESVLTEYIFQAVEVDQQSPKT